MSNYRIPFNRVTLSGLEKEYILQALEAGHMAGDGPFARKCETFLENQLGVSRALLTSSGTHALEMAALLLDLGPGDEVIVPSFTFVSTVNAFVLRGARPVFIDIRPDTLNLDESQHPRLITSRTRVIVPVHYAGIGCEMETILAIAEHHGIAVLEDNAHGLLGKYRGSYLGTFGRMAALSFHETKNFTCGEGGALLLQSPNLRERAEIIREKGTDRGRFSRGEVDRYTWMDLGSSYLLSEIPAAFLYAQLEAKEVILKRRREIWRTYYEGLESWAVEWGVRLPVVPLHCEPSYHMFYLLMPSFDHRQSLIEYLKEKGILSVFHYQPLHLSKMGKKFGGKRGGCPVAEEVSERLIRLPFYNALNEASQEEVVSAIKGFRCGKALKYENS